MRRRCRPKLK